MRKLIKSKPLKKVIVQHYDEEVEVFYDVTEVKCFCGSGMLRSDLDICQGKKKITLKLYKLNWFEVQDM